MNGAARAAAQSHFPVMVKVWAGREPHDFRYICRSLPSLLASDLPANARVVLIDDCSPNRRVVPFLVELAGSHDNVEVWRNPERMGPDRGQEYNFPRLVERFPDAPYYVLCDDDVIYHPGWLRRLIQVAQEARAAGINGIFTALNTPAKPSYREVGLATSAVLLKERQMALNWLVPRDVYDAVGPFRATGLAYDHDYGLRLKAAGFPVICLKPSYVQNIGYKGAYQSDDTLVARDYVGRVDWRLRLRKTAYACRRRTAAAIQALADRIPEGRLKHVLKRTVRAGQAWLVGG
jgi:GT2 family glycosyltransferase